MLWGFGLEFGGVKWRRSRRSEISGAAQPQWNVTKQQTEAAADAVNSMPFVTSTFFAKWSGPGRERERADWKTVE